MRKLKIAPIMLLAFLWWSPALSAQNSIEADYPPLHRASAYNQNGIFCGYEEGEDMSGVCIRQRNQEFFFTLNVEHNDFERIVALPDGTAVNFDFTVTDEYYDSAGGYYTFISITRLSKID